MIPAKLTVTGHDNSARALRRAHPRQGRFLRFGNDFVVRPKRRIEVDMATLIRHKDAVVEKIRSGNIVLSHATDTFVTVEEFLAFCAGTVPQEAPVAVVEPETVPETAPEPETAATGNVEPATDDEPEAEQAEATELEPEPETETAPETVVTPAPAATTTASYDNSRGKKGRR